MLRRFTVKNYKSIRDTVTLDMCASQIMDNSASPIRCADGEQLLPLAVILGMPGSGKTTLFDALQTLRKIVLDPVLPGQETCDLIPVQPFLFSRFKKKNATEFSIVFRTSAAEYSYTLHVKVNQITYECLRRRKLPQGRQTVQFERTGNRVERKGQMTKLDADDVLTEKTPFLSCLGLLYPENAIVSDVIDWFRYGINCLDFEKPADALLSDSAFMIADMPEEIRKDALRLLKELTPDVDQWQVETCEENGEEYLNVTAVHTVDGVKTQLALQEEPLYVRKMFILLPFLMYSLACGTVLAVDGLDLGLEPELVECLLMFYQNPEANQTGAQLITTAHGTSAMEFVDIRQDEFWYVEKGRQQDTKIYSLLDLGQDDQEEPPGGYTGPHAL